MSQLLDHAPPIDAPGVDVARLLMMAATEAHRRWQQALDRRDFVEVARWVDASQAVHRALVAVEDYRG